ncbi:hypothetical protein O6H91_16G004000 [Diphasiastrum complanatum]|uniref:Uncharacterized protein n=1 Tax=Diphasiastrum complanatum TaxID=34168 RepID=A0ACC2B9G6_DIPCM|nr:hypothetical protein O6H91_16G004000 [Diphasiastrum complanatum]
MGNCQAVDTVAAVVEYPGGRIEKLYWAISARHLMLQNPGYYLAVYSSPPPGSDAKPKLKLLPPAAILISGNRYRLISFEDVLRDHRKDGKTRNCRKMNFQISKASSNDVFSDNEQVGMDILCSAQSTQRYVQWKPSLQSISEREW